ncbi:hypothetical protein [Agrobacterium sp. lyk4-40-TYG-31]|uniref:hypothetical protein n=1 Tax=Agrobacterium sp. lyk4-40-TYG-31 TaxID=3040276 RepID=UPI0025500DFA|nr:hypothetical protein [Agrobacterium sp. lyk4-40-TYG-31]
MSNQFPLRPDDIWYSAMRDRYGETVPDIERLQIRRGLQRHVGDMYAQLHDLDLLCHVDIISITTRNAGFIVIDTRYHSAIYEEPRIALDFALEARGQRLNAACEHCGRTGEIVAKAGLEVLLEDPDAVRGDRLLCTECYESWSGRNV